MNSTINDKDTLLRHYGEKFDRRSRADRGNVKTHPILFWASVSLD